MYITLFFKSDKKNEKNIQILLTRFLDLYIFRDFLVFFCEYFKSSSLPIVIQSRITLRPFICIIKKKTLKYDKNDSNQNKNEFYF